MLIDGLQLIESSSVVNLVVSNGVAFPVAPDATPNDGELFYLTSAITTPLAYAVGLYYFDGIDWQLVVNNANLGDQLLSSTVTLGTTLPLIANATNGQLFYKTTTDVDGDQGLYVFNILIDPLGGWEAVSSSVTLSTHLIDETVHLTSAQNTWIDAITASSTQVNYLSTSNQDIQTQLNDRLALAGGTMTGSIVIPTGVVIQIADAPTVDTSAANKAYVDARVAGLSWKNAVKVATTTNITLSGTQTIDGIAVIAGDRVLVKDQTLPKDNGIYVVAASAWTRSTDFDSLTPYDEINSTAVFVEQGTLNTDTGWTETATVATLGTDAITFTQFNGAAGISPGVGLAKTGNTLSVLLGAGISELPTSDVGVDIHAAGGLFLTENGSIGSTSSNSQLAIKLDGGTLSRTGSGLQVKASGITAAEISNTAFGTGLTGGGGTVISLSTTGVTANTYGSSSLIPIIIVDAYGRITSASTTSFSSSISLTGDATGSGSTGTPIILTLANSGVTAGTYNNSSAFVQPIVVDIKGRITGTGTPLALTPAFSSITGTPTTLAGYGITDAVALDGDLTAIGALSATSGWLKKTAANTWALVTPTTLSGFGITDGQLLDSTLTAISGLSKITGSGLLKLVSNSVSLVPTLDTNTYLTSHPSTSPQAATSVSNSGFDFIQGLAFDAFGHVTAKTTATIPSGSTSQAGVVQLSDSTSTTSSVLGATSTAVKAAYDHASEMLPKAGGTMTGALTLNSDPTAALHAATKQYVDNNITGLDMKASVRVATTGLNITLSAPQTIDGISVIAGDRVLVKDQTTSSANGIYVVNAGAWSRATDADTNTEVTSGLYTFVEEGSSNGATGWVLATTGIISLGTTGLLFTQFTGLGQITAGAGLSKTGTVLDIGTASTSRIVINSDSIDLAAISPALTTGTFFNGVQVDAYGRITSTQNTAYLTGNQSITISGDVDGSGTTAITLTLKSVATAGTSTKVTYNAKGLITSGSNLIASDIPNLDWTKITTGKPTTLSGYGITNGQALDADLTAIAALTGTAGFLKTNGSGIWSVDTATYLTGNQSITISGDVTGSGSTSIALTLANSGVAAATYGSATQVPQFIVDIKGRITSATGITITPAFSSITGTPTTLAGYGITDAAALDGDLTAIGALSATSGWLKKTAANTWALVTPTTLSGFGITDGVNLGGSTMTGALILSADPVTALGAATKQYVDNSITGLDMKASVLVATTGNISLSGLQIVDGITVAVGNRVLVKNQSTTSENGLYIVSLTGWTRTPDADTNTEVTSGMYTFVETGTVNASSGWVLQTGNPITVGTTSLVFTQFNGLGQIVAGAGLTKTGNQLDIGTASTSRIVINSDSIDLATTGITLGAYGSATQTPTFTVDAYGRLSVAANATITPAFSSITGKPTTLAGYGITNGQPLDADLTAIAALTGTTGFLKTNGSGIWSVDTAVYLTSNQAITLTGDITGTGNGTFSTTLATVNTNVGAFGSATQVATFTVNAKGLTTAAGLVTITPAFSSITGTPTTLSGYGITNGQPLDTDLTAIAALTGTTGFLKTNGSGIWSVDTAVYLTSNQAITISGDVTGSGSTSIALTLANSGVAAATYGSATQVPQFIVDIKGRITSATGITITPAFSSITSTPTTLAGYGITDAAALDGDLTAIGALSATSGWLKKTAANTWALVTPTTLSGFGITDGVNLGGSTMTGALTLNSDPTAALHAATKQYVDNNITGLDMKASVRVATTGNISLSGLQIIDGITVAVGNRVLVKNQSTTSENGLYTVSLTGWTRTPDAAISASVTSGMYTFVEEGSSNGATGWVLATTGIISLGTTGLLFTQFTGLGQITAGAGLSKTGNQLDIGTVSSSRIVVNSDSIDLATTGITLGAYGSATQTPTFTVDAYGRLSVAANATITPAFSSITGKPTTLSGYGITNGQPLDADLTAIAALTGTAGFLKTNGSGIWSVDTAVYLTSNQAITLTGDITGTGNGTFSTTLATVNTNVGAFGSATQVATFTVNAKGLTTAAGLVTITPAFSSITGTPTTLSGYGITDGQPLDTDLTAISALTPAVGFLRNDGPGTWSYSDSIDGGSF